MMWIYILIGAVCVIIGGLFERQISKSLEQQLDSVFFDMGKLNRELSDKNNELLECRNVIRKLESKNVALKNLLEVTGADVSEYTVEGYDLTKLEHVNNHLRMENAGLIRKNKNLTKRNNQYKANVKQLKKELDNLTTNPDTANDLKLQRYKKEIRQLHEAILDKNRIINEYIEKYGEL